MKISGYEVLRAELPLVEGYRITGKHIDTATNFLVRLRTESGLVGLGCAAPSDDVTGESNDNCEAALKGPLRELVSGSELSADPTDIARTAFEKAENCPAARAAVDMALWDLAAQRASQPLVLYWGGNPKPVATSVTIGICDVEQTLAEAEEWVRRGYVVLKIKIGEDLDVDLERLARVREQVGANIVIRVDANQGYDLDGARRLLRESRFLDIEMFEQPLAQSDLDGLATLAAESSIPVIADESACTVADCRAVVDRHAGHGVNIKLMKCGGPSAAWEVHDYAQAAGMSLMIGCNDETRISIAAGVHLAQSMPGMKYVDLDGHMDLASDPSSGGFEIRDGLMYLLEKPGLGVELSD